MQRYFFDLQHEADAYGVQLPDAREAGRYALRYAAELIRDLDVDAHRQHYWRMDVRGEDEAALFSVVLEMLPVRSGAADHPRPMAAGGATLLDARRRRSA